MRYAIALAGLGSLVAGSALAQTPIDKPDGYKQVGMATYGIRQVLTLADTAYDIEIPGGAVPACFAHRTIVVIKAMGGEVACVWHEATPADITFTGAADSEDACSIDDAEGPNGPGACFMLSDTERHDQAPWPLHAARQYGARNQICDGAVIAPGGASVYPKCNADADCTTAGVTGGTCGDVDTAAERRQVLQQGCAFLTCQTDTAGAYVYVGVEQ